MNGKRLACIYIPDFPLQVFVKDDPRCSQVLQAVAEKGCATAQLVSVNQEAEKTGVTPGMTVAQARSRCPELHVLVRDCKLEDEQSGKILRLLQAIGPFVEEEEPGLYFLETTGITLLHKSEAGLLSKVLADFHATNYPVKIGIAGSKIVAKIAANLSQANDGTLVSPNTERGFLAPLPVEYLSLPLGTVEKLYDLGIETIGKLASFPPNAITHRFGEEVLELAQLARGDDPSVFLPEQLAVERSHELVLDYPIFDHTSLCIHLEGLVQTLLQPLAAFGQGCQTLIIQVECEDRTQRKIRVALDRPTASVVAFLRQIRVTHERCRLQAGITSVKVSIPAVTSLSSDQLDLDEQPSAKGRGQVLLPAEIQQRQLYTIRQESSLLPERGFTLVPFQRVGENKTCTAADNPSFLYPPYTMRSISGLRLLTPPKEACIKVQGGQLSSIRFEGSVQPMASQNGPWRLSGDWWNTEFDRLYYEIETVTGLVLLLFFDRVSSKWFVQGVFD